MLVKFFFHNWVLILDTGFRFSTPYPGRVACRGRWFHAEQCRPSTYVRIIYTINCSILTSINTTSFHLNPDF